MLFIDNKYTRWYYELIAIARARNLVTRAAAKQILGYVGKDEDRFRDPVDRRIQRGV